MTTDVQNDDMDTLSQIRRGIERQEENIRATPYRVLLWGPSTEQVTWFKKRQRIARRLRKEGVEAYLSEKISKKVRSSLGIVAQEGVHWKHFDLVLVLDFSVGPGQEIASYASDPEFVERTLIFHPHKWDPALSSGYGAAVLEQFPNRVPCRPDEEPKCIVLKSSVHRVRALRALEFRKREISARMRQHE